MFSVDMKLMERYGEGLTTFLDSDVRLLGEKADGLTLVLLNMTSSDCRASV